MEVLEERTRFAEQIDVRAYMRREIDPAVVEVVHGKLGLPDLEAAVRGRGRTGEAGVCPAARERHRTAGLTGRAEAPGGDDQPARVRAASAREIIPFPGAGTPAEPPVARPAAPAPRSDLFRGGAPIATPAAGRTTRGNQAGSDERDLAFLQLTVEFAFAVARCDGRMAQKERDVIAEYLERRWGQDPILSKRAKAFSTQYEFSLIDPDACLQQIAVVIPGGGAGRDPGPRLRHRRRFRRAEPAREQFLEKTARKLGLHRPRSR